MKNCYVDLSHFFIIIDHLGEDVSMLMGRSSRSASAPDTSKIEDNPEANRKLLHSLTTEQVMVYNNL